MFYIGIKVHPWGPKFLGANLTSMDKLHPYGQTQVKNWASGGTRTHDQEECTVYFFRCGHHILTAWSDKDNLPPIN
jgi:hypothetical protein